MLRCTYMNIIIWILLGHVFLFIAFHWWFLGHLALQTKNYICDFVIIGLHLIPGVHFSSMQQIIDDWHDYFLGLTQPQQTSYMLVGDVKWHLTT